MYSYIILAYGTEIKFDNCQEHKWDYEVNIRSFLIVNILSSQQLADISRYLELLHQLLSACLLDVCCNYYNRIFVIIGGFSHFQDWGSRHVGCLTFSQFVIWLMNASSDINSTHCPSAPIWHFRYSLQQHSRLVLLLMKSISDRIMDISLLGG